MPWYEILEGVKLPDHIPFISKIADRFRLSAAAEFEVLNFITRSKGLVQEIKGTPKDNPDSFKPLQNIYEEVEMQQNKDHHLELPSQSYKLFGTDRSRCKDLMLLLRHNPIMAGALTTTTIDDGSDAFELISFDPTCATNTHYSQAIRTLRHAGHRVNFRFDATLSQVLDCTIFDDVAGTPLPPTHGLSHDKLAASALYNLLFFAQCVHATIHILHFLLHACLIESSKGYTELHQRIKEDSRNVGFKYNEVGVLLIGNDDNEMAGITGRDGFGSSQVIRRLLKDLLNSWGSQPTARGYLDTMMNISLEQMERADILVDFRTHHGLIPSFASELSAAWRTTHPESFQQSEKALSSCLQQCGFQCQISTLADWYEIITVTGIVHGTTLGYARLQAMPDIVQWRDYQTPTWTADDVTFVQVGLATIVGMQPGRHAMSNNVHKCNIPSVQFVYDKYDQMAKNLKEQRKEELLQDPDLDEYGWILTDFCPDGFDGKQLTLTTYI